MTHDRPYRPVPYVPAPRLQDADGSICPHTYGVRVGPCRASATEPCRPTACIPSIQPPTFYQAASPDGDGWAVVATAAHFLAQSSSNHCSLITVHSSYTFSAKERDTETGLSYFGSRYYSRDLSIWLSIDPMSDKYPHQSNYVYCSNNPLKVIDPNGEDEWEIDNSAARLLQVFIHTLTNPIIISQKRIHCMEIEDI